MSPEDNGKKGPEKPGGGKDLDALKAKLGLKKEAAPKSPLGGLQKPAQKAAPKPKSAADDFKFSFGDVAEEKPALSEKELAAIDSAADRATKPVGRKVISAVFSLLLLVICLWLGYQFGNSMGERVIHNLAVNQAGEIKEFFLVKYANAAGQEIDARRDVTTRFVTDFEAFHEETITELSTLATLFEEGKIPPGFDLEKLRKETLAPLKKMCKDYLSTIEEFSVAGILKGQLYSTELGAKLLEFVDRTNKLRNRVETLYLSLELVEAYTLTGEMPSDLKGEVLVHAKKAEEEKGGVPAITVVELTGKPEIDKELETKEVCEPIAMELEIPICGARKDEPQTEKRLIETFEKKEVQEVRQFRKVKVKSSEGKNLTARIEHLFKMDLRPFLKPLLERIGSDKKNEFQNLSFLLTTLVQNMNDVRMAGEGVDFNDVIDSVNKYADQEQFFTL